MSVILAADGTYAHRTLETLPGRYGYWLVDGEKFLDHVADLARVGLESRCGSCGAQATTRRLDVGRIEVGCACRRGVVKTEAPLLVEPLLLTLGWRLVCAKCDEPLTGDNDPQAKSGWTLTCACTIRTIVAPVAGQA